MSHSYFMNIRVIAVNNLSFLCQSLAKGIETLGCVQINSSTHQGNMSEEFAESPGSGSANCLYTTGTLQYTVWVCRSRYGDRDQLVSLGVLARVVDTDPRIGESLQTLARSLNDSLKARGFTTDILGYYWENERIS